MAKGRDRLIPNWDVLDEQPTPDMECALVVAAMKKTGVPGLEWRADRVARCGTPLEYLSDWGRPYIVEYQCGDRLCPRCARTLSHRDRNRVLGMLNQMKAIWFVTLAVDSSGPWEIGNACECLTRSFGKLKQRQFWKKHVRCGIRAFELQHVGHAFRPHLPLCQYD